MSAYFVDKATIDAIVTVWAALDLPCWNHLDIPEACTLSGPDCRKHEFAQAPLFGGGEWLDQIGGILWRENARSVNHRYGGTDGDATTEANRYAFDAVPLPANILDALPRIYGAVRGLNYQACEATDYDETPCRRLLVHLETVIRERMQHDPRSGRAWVALPDEWRGVGWTIQDSERDVLTKGER